MKSLWGGRIEEGSQNFFFAFNQSFGFDQRLVQADIVGSQAYAKALHRKALFDDAELSQVLGALEYLAEDLQQHPEKLREGFQEGYEDVHSFVEFELTKRVGDLGKKLHTGRSRNDQVATDLRLYLRDSLDQTVAEITALQKVLVEKAEQHRSAVMPGYTHLQKAQPILFAHYLLSFFEMLERDRSRLVDARVRLNQMPLGSGALSGNSLGVDREALAIDLGFSGICANSLDATSDRDFVLEYISAASVSMMHLSRLAEDLILYCSDEFRFIKMGDQVSTGSSLMPQKKNPDALELIRGKCGRVYGHLMAMLTVMKGLPSCYNKDMQEDKEGLFDTIDTWQQCLKVMGLVVSTMLVNESKMIAETKRGYMNATDLADYYVAQGLPFREAHHLVRAIVFYAIEQGVSLDELPLATYQEFAPSSADDLYEALAVGKVLAKKSSMGGTAPDRVEAALKLAHTKISQSI